MLARCPRSQRFRLGRSLGRFVCDAPNQWIMAGSSVQYSKIDNALEQLADSHVIPERKVLCQCFNGNGVAFNG